MFSYQDIIRKRLASECVDGGFTSSYYTRDAAIALQIIAYALRGAEALCSVLLLNWS